MRTARSSIRRGVSPPGTPQSRHPPKSRHPPEQTLPPLWTEFLTHAYQDITLPQTSFAGGKEARSFDRLW